VRSGVVTQFWADWQFWADRVEQATLLGGKTQKDEGERRTGPLFCALADGHARDKSQERATLAGFRGKQG
jgi:hypothetical protein